MTRRILAACSPGEVRVAVAHDGQGVGVALLHTTLPLTTRLYVPVSLLV